MTGVPSRFVDWLMAPGRPLILFVFGVLLAAFVWRVSLADAIPAPFLLCDEFIYGGAARSFAESGELALRGSPVRQNVLYPILISPAWFASSMDTVYTLVKAINVLFVVASAGITFFWARRLVAPVFQVVAVVLVLLIPSWHYASLVMTESAFLGTFAAAAFAIALALERPTFLRQLVALGLIGIAYGIRAQGTVFVPALVGAVALKVLFDLLAERPQRRLAYVGARLRAFWPTLALAAGAIVAYLLFIVVTGGSLDRILGPYSSVLDWRYDTEQVRHWAILNLSAFVISIGVIPACALIVLVGLALAGRCPNPAERALVAVTTSLTAALTVQVGLFGSQITSIVERYMFYIAPLFFLALVVWLDRKLPRPLLATTVAVGIPAALALQLPTPWYSGSILPNNFGMFFLYNFSLQHGGVAHVETLIELSVIAAAIAFAVLARRIAIVFIPLAIGVFLFAAARPVHGGLQALAAGARASAGPDADWIDQAVGRDADVAYLLNAGTGDAAWAGTGLILQTEFWNRSVHSVITTSLGEVCPLTERLATVDWKTGHIVSRTDGKPLHAQYVVADGSLPPFAGKVVATRPGLDLYRISSALMLAYANDGVEPDGWMGAHATHLRYGPAGERGTVAVNVSRRAWLGQDVPGRVSIDARELHGDRPIRARRTWVVHSGEQRTFRIRGLVPPLRVDVRVRPTFSPSSFGEADKRQLGAQVGFDFVALHKAT